MNKTLFDGTHVDDYIYHITTLVGAALTICQSSEEDSYIREQVQIILKIIYNDLDSNLEAGVFDFLTPLSPQ